MRSILVGVAVLILSAAAIAQTERGIRILDTERHVVTVSKVGNDVVFVMEAIGDLTNDRDNSRPYGTGWDYAGMRVDINNNNVIDEMVDVAFGTRQKTNIFCAQYIISDMASTGCGAYRSKGRVTVDFAATELSPSPHPVYVYRIPIGELSVRGGKIGLVFNFGEPNEGRSFYPTRRRPYSFEETIQLDLSEMR